ncbi:aklavinone 12-hydroxylase RdmE [Gandjariella thermophila]|uniref:FAD-dependent oxidoreductase n=1 Tax=Gandjariella thermophila TaxID=1931992 RepID=A0A4D4JB35_9PSEU|nr:FAD-dependent oxidoreductase [Gandjariella thermophila]GDY32220.1 FAD-dependent oxidoreductase [Gandjariella thermophila]
MGEHRVQVLVVGAGLAGLSTAMFLAQRGVEVLVVERHAGTSVHPRAAGQNPRTMELLRIGGVAGAVLAASGTARSELTIRIAESRRGPVFRTLVQSLADADTASISPAPWGMATQDRVEPILLARARELGAEIRFDTELVSLAQDPDSVTARLLHLPSERVDTVRADYLVAADGNRSRIREWLGIGRHGHGSLAHHIGMIFEADLPELPEEPGTCLYYLRNPTFTGAFSSTGVAGRYLLSVEYHPGRGESRDEFTAERCVELIRTATGEPGLRPELLSVQSWEMAARIADSFRSGRVFLAGDAAKVTPPTGGLGGNTAVQDGYDLAWKLAAVLRGEAGGGLLDSYQAERAPVAELVVAESLHNYAERMAPGLSLDGVAEPVGYLKLVLGFRYRSNAVLAEDDDPAMVEDPFRPSGRPGFRAPHVRLLRDGTEVSTVDLFGPEWVLLTGAEGGVWHQAAQHAAARLGVPLRAHGLEPRLLDPDDALGRRYGIGSGGASLVRPDGIVAWRSAHEVRDPFTTLHGVLSRLLDRGNVARAA